MENILIEKRTLNCFVIHYLNHNRILVVQEKHIYMHGVQLNEFNRICSSQYVQSIVAWRNSTASYLAFSVFSIECEVDIPVKRNVYNPVKRT